MKIFNIGEIHKANSNNYIVHVQIYCTHDELNKLNENKDIKVI